MHGFYTPDLAMAEIQVGDLLRVQRKDYNPERDMVYWEFTRLVEAIDDIESSNRH